ncbi:integral membrane protein PTH11 [Fusarium mundagurra]|uniref:Integral membrane protein PTH11 n=1 Tax=Fusarium mundagurra TaxID=1567541 RepID=A0A8H5YFI4_9HYPO|nr:integral membrane protein PTH11 [Fusarium mundagurra]
MGIENAKSVDPQGLACILLGVSIFFLIPTAIVVILRCFIRLRYRVFGIDDSLMLIGWWMWIGQTIYCISLIPLKCSICVTLLRIAVTKLHRIIIWATIVFIIITMLYNWIAAMASLCTIIRLPYIKALSDPHHYLYNVAYIVLWSTVESGIGIIAGSLPSLRKLISSRFHFNTSTGRSPANITPFSGTNRATSQPVLSARGTYRSEVGNKWEQLDDAEGASSQKTYVDLEMQSLERSDMSRELHGSREDLV